ncbi:N-acetyl-beta-hexosaminidase [Pseudomonas fluorescens HK44]|uniref:N-acetyl-beta-hexosaminidase n=1 Tax=Pseudomonas fluorescens HK44 TaxID=1042209 RepID=A0A010TCD7_PSEFL|nr:family 20 glycosylhydrolase [Pseudomonas fluorescens]EXF94937.1 N-acetyl-beta-hexosaminidase [Pseudomonas fluorescens HK44]
MTTSIQSPVAASLTIPEDQHKQFPWTHLSPAVRHAAPDVGLVYEISASTRILIDNESLRPLATRLAFGLAGAAELTQPPAIVVASGNAPQSGDVALTLSAPDTADVPIPVKGKPETYRIDITNTLRVTAQTLEAMARALTTLNKAVLVSSTLEAGVVIDAPVYAERSVLIDVGRKYYSPEWMINLLQEMAWNQLNTLYLHLTDDQGVRVIFPSAPDTASPDAWSAEELKKILDAAAALHIEVVPGMEWPGHMDFILKNRPQFQLQLTSGTVVSKALDFSIPAARHFLMALVGDLLDMFPNCTRYNLEADEYFIPPTSPYNTPQLARYAQENSGPSNADSRDGARKFVNEVSSFVQQKGKVARMWNDAVVERNQMISVDKKVVIKCWSIWGSKRSEMNVQALIDAGYRVLNAHGDFYFVILTGWENLFHPLHSPHGLYDHWRPNIFMDDAGAGQTVIDPAHPAVLGGGIQIWADGAAHMSPEKVWSHLIEWMLPLGQRTWGSPNAAPDYKSLSLIARSVRYASPRP